MTEAELQAHYKQSWAERDDYTKAVLNSTSKKIVVVAGPGTGKTTLFSKMLEGKNGDALTLTFINALVDDLSLGLYGMSEVKTLHGFSASFLKKTINARVFPKLCEVIKEDAVILMGEDINFDELFQIGSGKAEYFTFYKARKDFYGKYYGFTDVVYALGQYLAANPHKIPAYKQIVVDEFQDFNPAEVAVIDLLADRSPTLVAGDDDQSLYTDLKKADPQHIRHKHGGTNGEYAAFVLPFCSRSTRVIVEAANDVVRKAKASGLLQGRIEKPYLYFPCKEKDAEGRQNPLINYTTMYQTQLARYMADEISLVAAVERKKFEVLVVMPPQLKKVSLPKLANALKKKGFKNISTPDASYVNEPTFFDGLKVLLEDKDSNLGWRVVAKTLLSPADFRNLIQTADGKPVSELLGVAHRKDVRALLALLRKVQNNEDVPKDKLEFLLERIGLVPHEIAKAQLHNDLLEQEMAQQGTPRAIKDIHITITTIPSSKGLSGDYVFITNFDDTYYSQDKQGGVGDKDVFNFLVALTRAKKKAFLISSKAAEPTLLGWIASDKLERQ
jgi:superfamily I DNA/RNA helicase